MIIFSLLVYGLYIGEYANKISSAWYKVPTLLSSLFYCFTSISYILLSSTMDMNRVFSEDQVSGYFFTLFCFFILWLILSKLSIYVSILSRLYLTFVDSVYFVHKSILNLMICVLCLFLISGIYCNVLLYTKYRLDNPPKNYYAQFEVVFISLIIYDFISSVIMLLLFIIKLYRVIFARRKTMIQQQKQQSVDSISSINSMLDKHDMKFINAVTRYTILSCWQILTSQLGLLSLILLAIYVNYVNNHYIGGVTNKRWKQMHYYFFTFIAFDILINNIMLILYYEFTRKIYFKCCGIIHNCCKRCFVWNADRIMNKQISSLSKKHTRIERDTQPMLKSDNV